MEPFNKNKIEVQSSTDLVDDNNIYMYLDLFSTIFFPRLCIAGVIVIVFFFIIMRTIKADISRLESIYGLFQTI